MYFGRYAQNIYDQNIYDIFVTLYKLKILLSLLEEVRKIVSAQVTIIDTLAKKFRR